MKILLTTIALMSALSFPTSSDARKLYRVTCNFSDGTSWSITTASTEWRDHYIAVCNAQQQGIQ